MLCDRIITQFDYKRNNTNFYTQGINIQKGCYLKVGSCVYCCCCFPRTLYLRENMDPDNPDFNVGVKKGTTVTSKCCSCSCDKFATYYNEEGTQGYGVRLTCCEILKHCSTRWFGGLLDVEIDIEDEKGEKVGSIVIPNGLCSKKVQGEICHIPRNYYEINFPQKASSFEKFQLIADVIHFDNDSMILC